MKNETFWQVIRTILLVLITFFLAMNYWSSDLIEERLIQIQKKIDSMQFKMEMMKSQVVQAPVSQVKQEEEVESKYPNLLVKDDFEDVKLPELLGKDFKPYPLKFLASIGKPENLHPFALWAVVTAAYSYCVGSVGKLKTGFYEVYSPYLATRVEDRLDEDKKGGAYWIFLRKDVFWQPLRQSLFPDNVVLNEQFLKPHPVTAHDYKLYFDSFMNPFNQEQAAVVARQSYKDVEEFKVVDDYTFYVRWKYKEFDIDGQKTFRNLYRSKQLMIGMNPLPSFVFKYYPDGTKIVADDSDPDTYRTNSTFAQVFTEHWAKNYIVSNGPYDFFGYDDSGIKFLRNPQFFNPNFALYGEVENAFRNSQDSIWSDFKNGKMSTYELPSYQLPEYERFLSSPIYAEQKKQGQEIKKIEYLQKAFVYIGWNQARPLFKSKLVRQALTLAIDRNRIIQELFNGQAVPIVGPIFVESTNVNPNIKPLPFDPALARSLLEKEGWKDVDGEGVLKKEINGKLVPFKFSLIYFVKNPIGRPLTDFIATQLKAIGIKCEPQGVEIADLSAKIDDRDFDAFLLGWQYGSPPEDLRQIWSSQGKDIKGSSNYIGFDNQRVDQIIDELDYENNPEKRVKLYWEFQDIIHEEQPYTFLYTAITSLLYRETVHNVFIPKLRQDLIPGAEVSEPISSIFFQKEGS